MARVEKPAAVGSADIGDSWQWRAAGPRSTLGDTGMVAGSPAGGDARLPAIPRGRTMNGPDADQLLAAHLRTLRIIICGLLGGAAALAVVAVVLRAQGQMPRAPD